MVEATFLHNNHPVLLQRYIRLCVKAGKWDLPSHFSGSKHVFRYSLFKSITNSCKLYERRASFPTQSPGYLLVSKEKDRIAMGRPKNVDTEMAAQETSKCDFIFDSIKQTQNQLCKKLFSGMLFGQRETTFKVSGGYFLDSTPVKYPFKLDPRAIFCFSTFGNNFSLRSQDQKNPGYEVDDN